MTKAFANVVGTVVNAQSTRGKPIGIKSNSKVNGVASLIGVTRNEFSDTVESAEGQIFFTMSDETARSLASRMMMGIPIEKLDEMSRSAISELSNMIAGTTASYLAKEEVSIDIMPPVVMEGTSLSTGHIL